jgi:D-tyrosyl-tRNA(Tyr) deacylase
MKVLLQRVLEASVKIDNQIYSQINKGILLFVGISDKDTLQTIKWLSNKVVNLRIFSDDNGKMNLSVKDIGGEILIISQFTLYANLKKGTRPSYIEAARPEIAIPLYEKFITQIETDLDKKVQTGIFGADMKISLINDGPVTILLEK